MRELSKEISLQRVMRASGRVPVQCSCSVCKQQCHTPCLGTPDDIERIIDAGYADRLALTNWAAGIFLGVINIAIPMIQPVAGKEYCAFFETVRKDNFNPTMSIAWNVAKEWLMPENEDVLSRVVNKFLNARKP